MTKLKQQQFTLLQLKQPTPPTRTVARNGASAERVAALSKELQQLGDAATPPMRNDVLQTALAPRLSELGPGMTTNWPASGQLQLSGETDFAVWIRWTAAMQAEYRLVLEHCRISGSSGRVRIEASYRTTGNST